MIFSVYSASGKDNNILNNVIIVILTKMKTSICFIKVFLNLRFPHQRQNPSFGQFKVIKISRIRVCKLLFSYPYIDI